MPSWLETRSHANEWDAVEIPVVGPSTVFILDPDETVQCEISAVALATGMHVHCYSKAGTFLEEFVDSHKGCLVLEVSLPDMSGFELQQRLTSEQIDLPVLFLTDQAQARLAVRAIRGGALDYLKKPVSPEFLRESLLKAADLHKRRREWDAYFFGHRRRFDQLTLRELQVFSLVVTGVPNKAIGRRLQVSEGSVETYRYRMMEKLQAQSVADLVRISMVLFGFGHPPVEPKAWVRMQVPDTGNA